MFKKFLIIFLFGLLGIFIQGTLFKSVFPDLYVPNILIGILIFLCLYEPNGLGALGAFMLGLLFDLFSHQYLGPWAGAFIGAFAIIMLVSQRIFASSGVVVALAGLLASALTNCIYMFIILPYRSVGADWYLTMLVEVFLSALFAPLMFALVKRVYPGGSRAAPGFFDCDS